MKTNFEQFLPMIKVSEIHDNKNVLFSALIQNTIWRIFLRLIHYDANF